MDAAWLNVVPAQSSWKGMLYDLALLPVSSVANKKITTIEGISENGDHPVQTAWLEHDVAQCGYCQAGQIMTAVRFIGKEVESKRRRNRNSHEWQYLPLCDLSAYQSRHKDSRKILVHLKALLHHEYNNKSKIIS